MRFKDFLREAGKRHREDISLERAKQLLAENCKDADIMAPMWRGSKKASEEVYLITGENSVRSSANTSNHYTVCIDEFLPALGYPKRSASIICTNYRGKGYARSYKDTKGALYAIIPFDGVKMGQTKYADIWEAEFELGEGRMQNIQEWNDMFEEAGIPDYSYEDMVNGIKETLDDPEAEYNDEMYDVFRASRDVEQILKGSYGNPKALGVTLITSKDLNPDERGHEIWVGGKCLAIRHDVWKELANSSENEEDDHDPDAEL